MKRLPRALLIMGPTASGKSAVAVAIAKEVAGEIVNADSMQVYRDLRVLTARPTPEDEAQAAHHLYGRVDAAERYSVGRWLEDAQAAISAIRARGATPIVAGGTGLYFKVLTEGLIAAPAAPDEIRESLFARLKKEGASSLHSSLTAHDPEGAARISRNDGPRILRALSVWETTGRPLRDFAASQPIADWSGIVLAPDRKALYPRIDARFDTMLESGVIEEVRALEARGLDPALPAMKAHGVVALLAHLRGEIDLARAAELAKRDTRRYAKRQYTWIAHQLADWRRVEVEGSEVRAIMALAELRRED